jgi:hypothetical protein
MYANPIVRLFSFELKQNLVFRKPFAGSAVVTLFFLAILLIYRPLGVHSGDGMSYEWTMIWYSLIAGFTVLITVSVLKLTPLFNPDKPWTVGRESLAVFVCLFDVGFSIWLAAFFIEPPAERGDLATFLNSMSYAFLLGIIPFLILGALSWRGAKGVSMVMHPDNSSGVMHPDNPAGVMHQKTGSSEPQNPGIATPQKPVVLQSRSVQETLSLSPERLLFAESEGNYTVFHVTAGPGNVRKDSYRITLGEAEAQLRSFDYIIRTHRAYMLNVYKIAEVSGNRAGFRVRIEGHHQEIPVSRSYVDAFIEALKVFRPDIRA